MHNQTPPKSSAVRLNNMFSDPLYSTKYSHQSQHSQHSQQFLSHRSSPKLTPDHIIRSYRKIHQHHPTDFIKLADGQSDQPLLLQFPRHDNRSRIQYSLQFNEYQKSCIDHQSLQSQSQKVNDVVKTLHSRQLLESSSQKRVKIKIPQSISNPSLKPTKKIELDPNLFGSLKAKNQHKEVQNIKKKEEPFRLTIPTFFLEFQIPYKNFKSLRPSFIEGTAMALVNEKIYLYGGIGGSGMQKDVYEYHLKDMAWSIKESKGAYPKEGRFGHSMVLFRNVCYVFGGSTMCDRKTHRRECFNTLHSLNVVTGYWTKVQMQGDYFCARRHHKVCLYGSRHMLVYGGIDNNEQVLSDMAIVNLDKNLWKYLGDNEGQEIAYHALINITKSQFRLRKAEEGDSYKDKFPQEIIYCFGGKNGQHETLNTLKVLHYHHITDLPHSWQTLTTKGQPPTPVYNHTLEYYAKQHCIILIGGRMDMNDSRGLSVSSSIHLYYITYNVWQQITVKGDVQARCAHVSTRYGENRIVLFGGIGDDKYLDAEVQLIEMDQSIVHSKLAREQVQQKKQKKQQQTEEIPNKFNLMKKIDLWDQPSPNNKIKKRTLTEKFQDWQSINTNIKSYLPVPKKRQPKVKYHLFQAFLSKFLHDNQNDLKKLFKNKDEIKEN